MEHHSGRVCSYSGVRGSDGRGDVISVQKCGEVGDWKTSLPRPCVINPHLKSTQTVKKWLMDRRNANFGQRRADVIDGR